MAIDRRLARSVLAEVIESETVMGSLGSYYEDTNGEGDLTAAAVERLMVAAVDVTRVNKRGVGECILMTFPIKPDPQDD